VTALGMRAGWHRTQPLRKEAEWTLLIRGPKCAEPLVKLLAKYKAEVLAALAPTTNEVGLLAPPQLFGRVTQPAEGEPGLEQPCAARRGRVQELEGAFLHFCVECGRFAPYGYSARLRAGQLGRWYCREHRPPGALATARRKPTDDVLLACGVGLVIARGASGA